MIDPKDVNFGAEFKGDTSALTSIINRSKANLNNPAPASFSYEDSPIPTDRETPSYEAGRQHSGGSVPTAGGSGMFNEMTGLRGNKAFRNNNPGNITGMSGKLLYGAQGIAKSGTGDVGDRSQLVYRTADDGWRAMNQLMSGSRYNNAPISSAFAKYQSDQNAWGNMKKRLVKSGIDVNNLTFNQLSPQQKLIFMNQRARHEGFTGAPLTAGIMG